ncbi:MAG: apolipoprotein N-acyltransferase [Woeseia sp.]|nr:apolipoprotein N-acyltransferase [Woeseia sp.]
MLENLPMDAWASEYPRRVRVAYFLLGILSMLSFAPFGLYPLALILVIPLLLAFQRLAPRPAAWIGFWYGAGLFFGGTYWLYVSIHVFGQAPLILALSLMVALVLIMAVYYAAAGWLIARFRGDSKGGFALLAAGVWVLIEWLRGWFLTGFPWMTFGYSQIDSPLSGFAPIVGIYGVSFLLLLSAGALVSALRASGRSRAVMVFYASLPWIAGFALQNIEWTEPSGDPVVTTIVQGGVSQDRKWLPEQFEPTLKLYRDSLSDENYNLTKSQLIIWPEVAIPSVIDRVDGYIEQLESDIATRGQTLLFGILERDESQEHVYNSVVALGGDSRQIYRKRHLVPFGEFFPVPDFIREWMRLMNLPYSDISPGEDVQPLLKMTDGNILSVAICYEDAYATEQLYALPEASILINVSNDAWFGDSIAPHQHLQIARMRALEVGRHVVRATNNGISAFIGPDGELIKTGPQFEYVAMSHDVQPRNGQTPFARSGNWPVISVAYLILLGFGWRTRGRQ